MNEKTIQLIDGLIEISNALIARVEKLEQREAETKKRADRLATKLYHTELRVRELDQQRRPFAAARVSDN